MSTNQNHGQKAHQELDHIFRDLLPSCGMAKREAQITLSHKMLDALIYNRIALSDAGTGIGKTYAYLAAGIVFLQYRAALGFKVQPILISTSSIALQSAVRDDYLPFLSDVLLAARRIDKPIHAVIRKGKSHYVCDERLNRRLRQIGTRKNPAAAAALLTLRRSLDVDEVVHLSGYDRERVCVPQVCDCIKQDCRYRTFLDTCDSNRYSFQICNHNLLLADTIHRNTGLRPLLPDNCAIMIDEAHKLPEAARQMFGNTLEVENIQSLIQSLRSERFTLAAESLEELTAPLLREMAQPFEEERPVTDYIRLLGLPARSLTAIHKQLGSQMSPALKRQLEKVIASVLLLYEKNRNVIFYTEEDGQGGTRLCATIADLNMRLRAALWHQPRPILLTSGTLAVGRDFRRFKEETGLAAESRVTQSVSPSPFNYRKNCLLYLPQSPPHMRLDRYYDELTEEISALLNAAHGHALVLFTSYAAMSAVKDRLTNKHLPWPLFVMGRNAVHTTDQFKEKPGSILLAAGAAWEGLDFPGDNVSMLIIPRLPFSRPDAVKEKEREKYPALRSYIQAVVVPEMQIKLRQGFGRAIRTDTDTCVVAALDERASRNGRYFRDMQAALPDMRLTSSLHAVEKFIRRVKAERYFTETE